MGINHEDWLSQLNPEIAYELDGFLDILLDEGEIQKLIIYPKGGKPQGVIYSEDTHISWLKNSKEISQNLIGVSGVSGVSEV